MRLEERWSGFGTRRYRDILRGSSSFGIRFLDDAVQTVEVAFNDFDGGIDENLDLRFGVDESSGGDRLLGQKHVLGDDGASGVTGRGVFE